MSTVSSKSSKQSIRRSGRKAFLQQTVLAVTKSYQNSNAPPQSREKTGEIQKLRHELRKIQEECVCRDEYIAALCDCYNSRKKKLEDMEEYCNNFGAMCESITHAIYSSGYFNVFEKFFLKREAEKSKQRERYVNKVTTDLNNFLNDGDILFSKESTPLTPHSNWISVVRQSQNYNYGDAPEVECNGNSSFNENNEQQNNERNTLCKLDQTNKEKDSNKKYNYAENSSPEKQSLMCDKSENYDNDKDESEFFGDYNKNIIEKTKLPKSAGLAIDLGSILAEPDLSINRERASILSKRTKSNQMMRKDKIFRNDQKLLEVLSEFDKEMLALLSETTTDEQQKQKVRDLEDKIAKIQIEKKEKMIASSYFSSSINGISLQDTSLYFNNFLETKDNVFIDNSTESPAEKDVIINDCQLTNCTSTHVSTAVHMTPVDLSQNEDNNNYNVDLMKGVNNNDEKDNRSAIDNDNSVSANNKYAETLNNYGLSINKNNFLMVSNDIKTQNTVPVVVIDRINGNEYVYEDQILADKSCGFTLQSAQNSNVAEFDSYVLKEKYINDDRSIVDNPDLKMIDQDIVTKSLNETDNIYSSDESKIGNLNITGLLDEMDKTKCPKPPAKKKTYKKKEFKYMRSFIGFKKENEEEKKTITVEDVLKNSIDIDSIDQKQIDEISTTLILDTKPLGEIEEDDSSTNSESEVNCMTDSIDNNTNSNNHDKISSIFSTITNKKTVETTKTKLGSNPTLLLLVVAASNVARQLTESLGSHLEEQRKLATISNIHRAVGYSVNEKLSILESKCKFTAEKINDIKTELYKIFSESEKMRIELVDEMEDSELNYKMEKLYLETQILLIKYNLTSIDFKLPCTISENDTVLQQLLVTKNLLEDLLIKTKKKFSIEKLVKENEILNKELKIKQQKITEELIKKIRNDTLKKEDTEKTAVQLLNEFKQKIKDDGILTKTTTQISKVLEEKIAFCESVLKKEEKVKSAFLKMTNNNNDNLFKTDLYKTQLNDRKTNSKENNLFEQDDSENDIFSYDKNKLVQHYITSKMEKISSIADVCQGMFDVAFDILSNRPLM